MPLWITKMKRAVSSIASVGILSALTIGGVSAQKAVAVLPTHAIRGVVKSISTFYVVVLTGSGKKAKEMTFVLNPSTEKDGDISIGAVVSVRYRKEGSSFVSTAVSAQPVKQRTPQTPRK